MKSSTTVAGYIASAPLQARDMMKKIRVAIRSAAPRAQESISYGMSFYAYKYPGYRGRLAYFGAFANHVSLFIIPRKVPADIAAQLKRYKAAKATLQFPLGSKVPVGMIKKLLKLRMREIDSGT